MPPVSSADENSTAMLLYQANMANSMKAIVELLSGRAEEQTRGVERMVKQFTDEITGSMGSDFEKLGWALRKVVESQQISTANCRGMEDTIQTLLSANQKLLDELERISSRQDQFAGELEQQRKILAETCKNLDKEISNQLYSFQQMKSLDRR